MLVHFKRLAETTLKIYQYRFKAKGQPTVINLYPFQKHYIIRGSAYAQLAISKKGMFIYINGLISFKKGHGQDLIREVIGEFPDYDIRLNCLGESLMSRYIHYGFRVTYMVESHTKGEYYYEMVVEKERYIKQHICENCLRYYNSKCLMKNKEVSWDDDATNCDMYYNVLSARKKYLISRDK
jgi:hypothetical protein